ncbi:hypothetical protein RBH58_28805 [Escherichia coli]|uniref:hypothetical protein n=1 Tax=Escherichia coli TaxID=562 RepID=UPI001DECF911|nr:hypothetical protein [Escherichia coli]EIA0494578.1 hypothetical protein [Escherichia coli]EKR5308920.1 hypothetical protein [Escherichia coli]ELT4259887.1 hypothetical protein [Escherichia coli]EMC1814871.1 hypothetical protein [Escherichia coli]
MACEYQHFTDNLPLHLRERIMVCAHPDDIDDFSDKVIQKAIMMDIIFVEPEETDQTV